MVPEIVAQAPDGDPLVGEGGPVRDGPFDGLRQGVEEGLSGGACEKGLGLFGSDRGGSEGAEDEVSAQSQAELGDGHGPTAADLEEGRRSGPVGDGEGEEEPVWTEDGLSRGGDEGTDGKALLSALAVLDEGLGVEGAEGGRAVGGGRGVGDVPPEGGPVADLRRSHGGGGHDEGLSLFLEEGRGLDLSEGHSRSDKGLSGMFLNDPHRLQGGDVDQVRLFVGVFVKVKDQVRAAGDEAGLLPSPSKAGTELFESAGDGGRHERFSLSAPSRTASTMGR